MLKKNIVSIIAVLLSLSGVQAPTLRAQGLDQVALADEDINQARLPGLCRSPGYQDSLKLLDDAGLRLFREAVCKFHAIIDDDPEAPDPLRRQETYERFQMAVEALQSAQDARISVRQQTLMGLMEAQVQCQIGYLYASHTADILGKSRFCNARQAAWAGINDLDWRFVDFRYGASHSGEYAMHFRRLNECQGDAGIFAPSYDELCGTGPSINVDAIVNKDIMPALHEKYFMGTAPIADIFNRKLDLAASIKKAAEDERANLTSDSQAISRVTETLSQHFNEEIKPEIDAFVNDYHEAAKLSKTILSLYESWSKGLLSDGSKNYEQRLRGPDGIQNKMNAMQELFTGADKNKQKDGLFIVEGVRRIVQRQQSAPTRARNLCEAYYCSIAAMDYFYPESPYDTVCKGSLYNKNPLCSKSQKLEIVFEGRKLSQTAAEFCSQPSVGLDKNVTEVNQMMGCDYESQ